jgi:hypothetical protein
VTPGLPIHLVEAALADLGWTVYRLVLGSGPALAAWRDGPGVPILVAVARATEPGGGGPYPRLDKIGSADVLASVTRAGEVTFHAPGPLEAFNPSPLPLTLPDGATPATRPLHAGEGCLQP